MKYLFIFVTALLFGFQHTAVTTSNAAEEPLLPESIAARSELAPVEKKITIFLREDDPVKLATLLNDSNEEYAQKGWSVFAINTYTENGDVDGFFVTYSKGLTVK